MEEKKLVACEEIPSMDTVNCVDAKESDISGEDSKTAVKSETDHEKVGEIKAGTDNKKCGEMEISESETMVANLNTSLVLVDSHFPPLGAGVPDNWFPKPRRARARNPHPCPQMDADVWDKRQRAQFETWAKYERDVLRRSLSGVEKALLGKGKGKGKK